MLGRSGNLTQQTIRSQPICAITVLKQTNGIGGLSRLNMNSLLSVIISTVFFTFIGFPISCLLGKITQIERLGLSLLLGVGLGTYCWFILYLLGMPFTLTSLFISGLILILIGLVIVKLKRKSLVTVRLPVFLPLERFLVYIIILVLLIAFIIASYNAITAWDSLALYDFRAHAIVLNHDLRDITASSYYLSYPLLVSLLHAAVYFLGGVNAQGMHTVIFAGFLAIVFGRVYALTNLRYALVAVCLNIFSYELLMHSTIAYANLPYTILLVSGFLHLVSGHKKAISDHLIVGSILIGLSTWVRSTEVFWIIGFILIIWQALQSRNIRLSVVPSMLILLLYSIWHFYHAALVAILAEPPLVMPAFFSRTTLNLILHNLNKIREYFMLYVFYPYLGLWIVSLGLLPASFKLKSFPIKGLTFVIFASLAVTVLGISIFSTYFPTWFQIGDSATRMLMFLIPTITVAGTTALFGISHRGYNEKN